MTKILIIILAIAWVRTSKEIGEESAENAVLYFSPIEIPRDYRGRDDDIELRLAYFREDVGMSLQHWHWHLVHPTTGPNKIVEKDRRGELFYYLHHQILARYNVERLCNGLNLVQLLDLDEPIEESYYPIISTYLSGKPWPSRPPNMRLGNSDIKDLRSLKERIFEAVYKKKALSENGTEIDINNESGIDILGNMVESSILSPNLEYYGNIHNSGHMALALIHDPEDKHVQTAGVMSRTSTAMRDPVFYNWHAFLDDFFNEHKKLLPPYDTQTLNFPGIRITSVHLCSYDVNGVCSRKNTLNTYFTRDDINLTRGVDLTRYGQVLVRVTHLNHDRFSYTINVKNKSSARKTGTVRIFIAPALAFENSNIKLSQQQNLMIEMDRFVAILEPGANTIERQSDESSITIPFEQTFRDLDEKRPKRTQYLEMDAFNYCGCGWPQHMLVPRGTTKGYPMVLFVMISDYNLDKVEDKPTEPSCRTGVTFCGFKDRKYPDKRPTGFPFDRPPRNAIGTLEEFLTPNMAQTDVTVIHSETIRDGNLSSVAAAIPV